MIETIGEVSGMKSTPSLSQAVLKIMVYPQNCKISLDHISLACPI